MLPREKAEERSNCLLIGMRLPLFAKQLPNGRLPEEMSQR
jgi:hypothetical protein